ncbi:Origin recognition complex subunit 6 [Sergentomyia squamirostris]
MSDKLIQDLSLKLGYRENPHILEKSTENCRLLSLKQNSMTSSIGEIAKVVICIDLAASIIGISFDTNTALKICGLKKSNYANYRRIIQKLIGGTSSVGVPELCLQLGLPAHVQEAAIEELPKYLKFIQRNATDSSNPQYAAVVLYGVARSRKIKVSKVAFCNTCSLKKDQWKILEDSWHQYRQEREKKSTAMDVDVQEESKDVTENLKRPGKAEEIEDYEVWKQRILTRAYNDVVEN